MMQYFFLPIFFLQSYHDPIIKKNVQNSMNKQKKVSIHEIFIRVLHIDHYFAMPALMALSVPLTFL